MSSRNRNRSRVLVIALGTAPVALAVALVLVIAASSPGRPLARAAGQSAGGAASGNAAVDPGTTLPGEPAPGFTLTDQFRAPVTLNRFRGHAVVLAFVDARCTTVCPLTTASMTEALTLLGPAGRDVQLLGVDANPDATRVADVRAYSAAHQMMHSWDFLTGGRRQLDAVWHAYHVYVAASHGNIDHEPAIYLIDPQGRERTLYLTQMAYATIPQQAQLIADGLTRIIPGHPVPRRVATLGSGPAIGPGTSTTLAVTGGSHDARQVTLGPGHPHVLVFLASWLSEVSDVPRQLQALERYHREAVSRGWPTVVAIDEIPAEPARDALARLLREAGPLSYPVVADTSGRVADGYRVQDLPWTVLTTSGGHILVRHDGWLSTRSLARAAAARAAS